MNYKKKGEILMAKNFNINSIFNPNDEEYKNFLRSKMLIKEDGSLLNTKFNRMQFVNPYHTISSTREFLFFTKPDLHIRIPGTTTLNKELGNDPYWVELNTYYKRVVHQLQMGADNDSNPFIPLLTNQSASSLDLPTVSLETNDTPQTIYGTSIQYPQGSFKSDESFDFSLEFYDDPWLDVYQFFKAWNEYENLKTLGRVSPPMYSSNSYAISSYTINKILHDQIGIFKFIVDDDMETIIHYSYLCGCFPKSVPRDTFKEIEPGLIRYSIDWHAQFVEDSNPSILVDFDQLCNKYKRVDFNNLVSIWDMNGRHVNGNWAACPYIVWTSDTSRPTNRKYLLKWYDI
jgi:hypothetical protein